MTCALAFSVGILILPGLLWRPASRMGLRGFSRAAAAALPSGLLAVVALLVWTKTQYQTPWSACRLAPALGILRGFPLYSAPDHGPINGWLYGPVSALLWMPAGFCRTAFGALVVSEAINLLPLVLALFAVCLLSAGDTLEGRVLAAWCGIGATASLLFYYSTWYMTVVLTADAAAVGFGAVGSMLLCRERPGQGRLALAAALTALSIWSKQLAAPLVVVQLAWLLATGRREHIAAYAAWLFCWLAGMGAVFLWVFGAANMYFEMWVVPTSQFLVGGWSEGARRLGALLVSILPAIALSGWAWLGEKRGNLRRSMPILMFAALAIIPVGILTSMKVGADLNSVHSYYFAIAGAAAAAAALGATRPSRYGPAILVLAIAFLAAAPLAAKFRKDSGPPPLKWESNEEAFEFARAHPGVSYFPWDPLATLMAENRSYHFEYGVMDRMFAGIHPSGRQIREGLPYGLRLMIYPPISRLGTMVQVCGPPFTLKGVSQMGIWTLYHYDGPGSATAKAPKP